METKGSVDQPRKGSVDQPRKGSVDQPRKGSVSVEQPRKESIEQTRKTSDPARKPSFSQGSAVVLNARHQHLHSNSYVPKDPRAVVIFLPNTGESCTRYAAFFKFLASNQIAVFALEQSPVIDETLVDNALYKHPNPELNIERISSNAIEYPAPGACSVKKYVDDVQHFAVGISKRLSDYKIDYFLCGFFYGGLMAAHSAISSDFPWKGIIMTSPDLSGPIGFLETFSSNLTANLEKMRALMPKPPSFALFRQKLMPKQLDHMGNSFSFISDPTSPQENEEDFETDDMHLNAARELDTMKLRLKLPILILNGKNDAKKIRIKADRFGRQIGSKDKTIKEFKELHTSLGLECPEVNSAVLDWIERMITLEPMPKDIENESTPAPIEESIAKVPAAAPTPAPTPAPIAKSESKVEVPKLLASIPEAAEGTTKTA
ncbi:hypothetical protein THRCLA_00846 [Thraustotheca clavata]|uniref:Serine aminopeptidase S33 domain-containing protein n=1 Tax=Thraustotheca clavata TaxID=74557 RepID=A0A1W0AA19_9STRA|nr:hypothetical protein THRCLA_00846 [Thraustotheca clavata]